MSVRNCSNCVFESPGGYGKSPCFLRSRVSGSVGLDWWGVVLAWSNVAFGRM
jgi:hypothetical protein